MTRRAGPPRHGAPVIRPARRIPAEPGPDAVQNVSAPLKAMVAASA